MVRPGSSPNEKYVKLDNLFMGIDEMDVFKAYCSFIL